MSEIEKMYRNAGIGKDRHCTKIGSNCFYQECSKCDYYNYIYPSFIAEKQLWLIKWLSDKDEYVDIHYDRYKGLFEMQTGSGGLCVCNDFEDALASRVNMIWQSLTEEEKQQVKGILE